MGGFFVPMNEGMKAFPFRDEDEAICPFSKDGSRKIGRAVKAIERSGWPDADDLDPRPGAGYASVNEIRVALYTASTPIALDVVTKALNQVDIYPPFGLVKRGSYDPTTRSYPLTPVVSFPEPRPFGSLQSAIKTSLLLTSDKNQQEYLRGETEEPHSSMYLAYEKLSHWRTGSTSELTSRGISTGAGATTNLLEAIRPVASRDLPNESQTLDQYTRLATNSYPLLLSLASDDIAICTKVLDELQDNTGRSTGDSPFNPEYFFINDQESLEITPDFIRKFKKKHNAWLGDKDAIGCPAMHSKALYLLWNWEVDIAKSIWSNDLES